MDRAGRLTVGQMLATAVLVLAAAIILPKIAGRDAAGGPAETAAPDLSEAAASAIPGGAPDRVNPAPYRQTIQQLETILYQGSAPDLATGDRISSLATQLGTSVMRGESRVRATQAGQRLMGFAGRIGAESDVGYATVNLPRARVMWEDVRGDVFEAASWFRGSSATLTTAQTPPSRVVPSGAVAGLDAVARQLDRLIALGKREADQFPEPYAFQPGSPELQTQATAFGDWSARWTERINRALGIMPRLPSNVDGDVFSAFQELQSAARELNEVGGTLNQTGLPSKGERASHFSTAEAYIARARQSLDRVR